MPLNLRISHKGLILVAVPLVFELFFVGILGWMLNDAERETQIESKARAIVSHINVVLEFVEEAAVSLAQYKSTGNADYLKHYDQLAAQAPHEFEILKVLLKDQPSDLEVITKLETIIIKLIPIMEKFKQSLVAGTNSLFLFRYLPAIYQIADNAKADMNQLIGHYRQISQGAYEAQARTRHLMEICLLIGVALNIALAIVLARFFAKSITSRLHTLTDNSMRLAKDQPLNPIIGGSDEIASLDKTFHEMAAALQESARILKASEERTRLVIENMPVGIITVTSSGVIESINPRTTEIFGYQPEELTGKHLQLLLPSSETSPQLVIDTLCQKATGRSIEIQAARHNGQSFPCELTISKYNIGDGERVLVNLQDLQSERFLVNLQDVTERHEIERLKQEFVAMVSHDLRTPLTSVQGTLTLLGEGTYGDLTETGQRRVQTAEQSIDRLINLINDLLDIEKLEAGKLTMKMEPVSVSSVIERSIDAVRVYAEQFKVSIHSPATNAQVPADGDRLVQVLVNLLSNAVKFSPEGANVTVSVDESPGWVKLEVKDEGRGIPAAYREAIFERFKQVQHADGARKKGTGLGLAICKAIVESHHGTIGVDSEEGKGSTFWFRIPRDS